MSQRRPRPIVIRVCRLITFIMAIVVLTIALGCGSPPVDQGDQLRVSPTVSRMPKPTRPMPPLAAGQKDNAVHMVESSGVVETINGGQEWETGRIARADLAGALGVSVEVEWMEPVESSGPWYLIHCEGIRKSVTSETWRNITRLEVIVDLLQRQVRVSPVAGYTVIEGGGEATAVRNPDETPSPPTIREVETGEILWKSISGRRFPTEEEVCPPGTINRNRREFR